jgi:hypothetical protein
MTLYDALRPAIDRLRIERWYYCPAWQGCRWKAAVSLQSM